MSPVNAAEGGVTGQPVNAEAVTFSPLSQPILFWSLSTAPVMIPFVTFNRVIRGTVGPLFINLALMMVLSSIVIMDLVLYTAPGVRLAGHIKRILSGSNLEVLIVISLGLSAVVAWLGLLWNRSSLSSHAVERSDIPFDALAKLLIDKGIITQQEFLQKISEEKAMYQKLLNPVAR